MPLMVIYLRTIFQERCRKNSRYSLRAFAQSLKVPPSSLSEILSGKRPLTKKFVHRVGKELNLSADEISRFL